MNYPASTLVSLERTSIKNDGVERAKRTSSKSYGRLQNCDLMAAAAAPDCAAEVARAAQLLKAVKRHIDKEREHFGQKAPAGGFECLRFKINHA
jgi:hypothetical protein